MRQAHPLSGPDLRYDLRGVLRWHLIAAHGGAQLLLSLYPRGIVAIGA